MLYPQFIIKRTWISFVLGILFGFFIVFNARHYRAPRVALESARKLITLFQRSSPHCSITYDIDLTGRFELERAVRILCYVNTIPETYENKARHVMNTWARQCTKVIFISSEDSTELPVINLNLTFKENRKHLWRKMQSALLYLYGFRNDYDFFFKADDDTYATVDNLRYALKDLNPDEPIISGYPFTHIIKSGHLSGGAGYVLSRATLKLLVEKALNKHPECPTFDEDLEDVKISMCAYAVGARFVPLVDRHSTIPYHVDDLHQNEYRFQWMDLKSLFDWELPYKKAALTDSVHSTVPFIRDDHNLLSEMLISLHYISPKLQYTYHFLTYYLRPVGIMYEQ